MPRKKESKEPVEQIKELVIEFLENLEVEAEVSVEAFANEDTEEIDHFEVNINSEETGLLIGRRGEVLNSLQLLVGVIMYKRSGAWSRIILDVGDYRKSREESVKEMASRIAKEVEESGEAVVMPFLTPLERRHVHMMLTDHKKVATESKGEGRQRRLVIKPRV